MTIWNCLDVYVQKALDAFVGILCKYLKSWETVINPSQVFSLPLFFNFYFLGKENQLQASSWFMKWSENIQNFSIGVILLNQIPNKSTDE